MGRVTACGEVGGNATMGKGIETDTYIMLGA